MPLQGPLDIADLGTILSVWAHPDDENYCCGAIMAEAVRRGQRVVCVTATRGELGSTDETRWRNGPDLAAVRTAELAETLAVLGVREHRWLDYPDGGCADVADEEAEARVRDIVQEVQPDTVLCFGPDGGTWHPDHIATSRWATAAAQGTPARVLHSMHTTTWQTFMEALVDPERVMMSDKPPVYAAAEDFALLYHAEGELLDLKYRAAMCQASQVGPLIGWLGTDMYRRMLTEEGFVAAGRSVG